MTLPMTFSDLEGHFRYCKWFQCVHLKNAAHIIQVNYSGWTSHVSSYFHCNIQLERVRCDAECDLL